MFRSVEKTNFPNPFGMIGQFNKNIFGLIHTENSHLPILTLHGMGDQSIMKLPEVSSVSSRSLCFKGLLKLQYLKRPCIAPKAFPRGFACLCFKGLEKPPGSP